MQEPALALIPPLLTGHVVSQVPRSGPTPSDCASKDEELLYQMVDDVWGLTLGCTAN